MVVDIPCTSLLNKATLWTEKDPLAATEFRREVASKGIPLKDRLSKVVVDFDARPGFIRIHSYPPAMYLRTMHTCSLTLMNTAEYKQAMSFRKMRKKTGGAKLRFWDDRFHCMVKQDLSTGLITPA